VPNYLYAGVDGHANLSLLPMLQLTRNTLDIRGYYGQLASGRVSLSSLWCSCMIKHRLTAKTFPLSCCM